MINLLDRIETKQKDRFGVIDYVNRKHVIFYDFTHECSLEMRLVLVAWRTQQPTMRFSIFCSTQYPDVELPSPAILPKNAIQNQDELSLEITEVNCQKRRFSQPN